MPPMCSTCSSQPTDVIRHESPRVYVPLADGRTTYLNLVQTDLRMGPAGEVMIASEDRELCTVKQAKEWVKAFQELIDLAEPAGKQHRAKQAIKRKRKR